MIIIPCSEILAQFTGPVDVENNCCYAPNPFCGLFCPTCTEIPLDGGLSALLIAGVAYGVKKVRSKLN